MIGISISHGGRGTTVLVAAGLVLLMLPVAAQTPAPPTAQFMQPQQLPQPQAQQPPPDEAPSAQPRRSPGFLESVGRWMDESAANMNKSLDEMWQGAARNNSEAAKASSDAAANLAKGAVDAAKGTADVLGKLGTNRVATGRERCAISANGAPDCRQAAERLCKSKGFSSGNSLENEAIERCPTLVLLRGNKKAGDCPVEHAVIRAMCQ